MKLLGMALNKVPPDSGQISELYLHSVYRLEQTVYCVLIRHDVLSLHLCCLSQKKNLSNILLSYFWNNSCHCSQDIKQPLRDERIFQTKARQNKTKLNWTMRKKEKKNVWDFKLRKIKMQAVSFIEFAVTLRLRTQIYAMCKISLYLDNY